MDFERILGVNVSTLGYEELETQICKDVENSKKSFIVAINPEKILKARKSEELSRLLQSADYPIADGIGVIIASKLKKGKIRSRVTGIDCMNMLCSLSNERGYKIFLYGAKPQVVTEAKLKLEEKYPNIKITGYIDGYEKDNQKIIEEINKSGADIVFVALGSPTQENWITANKELVCPKIFMGVGGSFDVISGNIKRAPKFMLKMGLEWLYRLLREPKRFFRQIKLIKFVFLVLFSK